MRVDRRSARCRPCPATAVWIAEVMIKMQQMMAIICLGEVPLHLSATFRRRLPGVCMRLSWVDFRTALLRCLAPVCLLPVIHRHLWMRFLGPGLTFRPQVMFRLFQMNLLRANANHMKVMLPAIRVPMLPCVAAFHSLFSLSMTMLAASPPWFFVANMTDIHRRIEGRQGRSGP